VDALLPASEIPGGSERAEALIAAWETGAATRNLDRRSASFRDEGWRRIEVRRTRRDVELASSR